jgi:hypothetical protein
MPKVGDDQIGELVAVEHWHEELSAKLVFEDLHSEVRNSHDVRRVCHIIMPTIFTAGFRIYRLD